MWDMAAKGFAWPGWISDKVARGKVADRGFHWTQEKFAVPKTMSDPEWKAALEELDMRLLRACDIKRLARLGLMEIKIGTLRVGRNAGRSRLTRIRSGQISLNAQKLACLPAEVGRCTTHSKVLMA